SQRTIPYSRGVLSGKRPQAKRRKTTSGHASPTSNQEREMSEVSEKVKTSTQPEAAATPVTTSTPKKRAPGLTFRRFFTVAGVSPYDSIEWEKRTASITDAQGNSIFEQKDVEVPKDWSMTATNIVASK